MDEATVEQQEQQAEQALHSAVQSLEQRLDEMGANTPLLSLLVRLAVKTGWYAGLGFDQALNFHFAAIDLPTGQVSWHLEDSDLPLFEGVPLYDKPVVVVTSEAQTQRISEARV